MKRWRVAGLAAAVLLAGCASSPPEPEPVKTAPGIARPVSESETLLTYSQNLRLLSGPELAKEHDTARAAYSRARSDSNRVRYAMVLTLPGAPFQDDARALEMLEPVAKNPSGQLQGLAQLLATHLQERKRLDANAQALQQKLDALRSLERNMIERKR